MTLDLKKFFTREAIVRSLETLPELKSPVMDLLYPAARRINHPFPVIGYHDLGLPTGNIPVVRRGGQSYALKPAGGSLAIIEPQSVNPRVFLDAATMNNLGMLTGESQQQEVNNKIDTLRRACRSTAEALAAQSITGKIDYPMATEGGALVDYEVDYGTPASVTVTSKWDNGGTTLAQIIKSCGEIVSKMKQNGFGSNVAFLMDFDVFGALIDKIGAKSSPNIGTVGPDFINLGGLKFYLMPGSYIDLESGALVSAVPAKRVVAVDMDAGHKLFYAALDDLDANMQALPFFAKPIRKDDPSGYDIVGNSKPLPVPNVKGIVTASVLV